MTFAQTMRLIWIDSVLSADGSINRRDIAIMFQISTPQASLDLRAYQAAFPTGIEYDRRKKCYRRVGADSLFDDRSRSTVADAAIDVHHWTMMDLS